MTTQSILFQKVVSFILCKSQRVIFKFYYSLSSSRVTGMALINPSGTPCHLPLQERLKGALRAIFLNIGITVLKPPLVRGGVPQGRRGFYIVIALSFHSSRMTVKVYTIYYALPFKITIPYLTLATECLKV